MSLKLKGIFTALITPFVNDGKDVDWESLEKIIDLNIEKNVAGLVPIGTTGESPTLRSDEKEKIIKLCVKKAKASGTSVKVIAGTGSNNTEGTVEATKKAKEWGADAVLIVNPYYNKPSQEGLYQHIKTIDEIGIPIVLYNIPGRAGVAMTPQTVARIYKDCSNVVAVKEATGSLDIAIEIRSLCDITILSGDDALTLPLLAIGGEGAISVTSNYKPEIMNGMCDRSNMENAEKTLRENHKLIKMMFCETNPVPIKFALFKAGLIKSPCVRQPLWELSDENQSKMTALMTELKLI